MRSLHVPMTWEEWERMPWRFGWKHEYWDGHAHLTPRHDHVHVHVRVEPRVAAVAPACLSVRPVAPDDARGLVQAFIEAFEDGVEFCDWQEEKIHEHARQNITGYFAGRRGTPLLNASWLALDGERRVAGAALLNRREAGAPALDLLMVSPCIRRRGVANALVGAGVETLRANGATGVLRSAYHVANEKSTRWHQAFGFKEEPDLFLANMRRAYFFHEMSRHEELETARARREHARLTSLYEFWSRRCEELEEVAEREGFEAVTPALRYRW